MSRVRVSRRTFVRGAAGAAILFGSRAPAAEEPVRVAVVGCGGRGADDLNELKSTGIAVVALCDADERRAARSFSQYASARRYQDWRRLLEKEAPNVDAVVVATPDHNHAIISIAAMKLGKHVYCEKPLAHSIWEARRMATVAAEMKVATQMGTQGHAFEGTRQAVEVIRSGALGEVRELHVWTDRPKGWWPQGVPRPSDEPPVPTGLDWDVWLGPAPQRPYSPAYVPFKWRGWWDFGTGAIGDMGVHNLDTAFWGLGLTAPTSVKIVDCSPALTAPSAKETLPAWSILRIEFPARDTMPPVTLHWYDGGKLPPADLFHGEPVPKTDGGSLVVGSNGTLLTRTWHGGQNPRDWFVVLPRDKFMDYRPPAPSLPRTTSHHQEWIDACRGKGKALSNFTYAATLTESLLIGDLALRVGKDLEWDAKKMAAPGCAEAEPFVKPAFRDGWRLEG